MSFRRARLKAPVNLVARKKTKPPAKLDSIEKIVNQKSDNEKQQILESNDANIINRRSVNEIQELDTIKKLVYQESDNKKHQICESNDPSATNSGNSNETEFPPRQSSTIKNNTGSLALHKHSRARDTTQTDDLPSLSMLLASNECNTLDDEFYMPGYSHNLADNICSSASASDNESCYPGDVLSTQITNEAVSDDIQENFTNNQIFSNDPEIPQKQLTTTSDAETPCTHIISTTEQTLNKNILTPMNVEIEQKCESNQNQDKVNSASIAESILPKETLTDESNSDIFSCLSTTLNDSKNILAQKEIFIAINETQKEPKSDSPILIPSEDPKKATNTDKEPNDDNKKSNTSDVMSSELPLFAPYTELDKIENSLRIAIANDPTDLVKNSFGEVPSSLNETKEILTNDNASPVLHSDDLTMLDGETPLNEPCNDLVPLDNRLLTSIINEPVSNKASVSYDNITYQMNSVEDDGNKLDKEHTSLLITSKAEYVTLEQVPKSTGKCQKSIEDSFITLPTTSKCNKERESNLCFSSPENIRTSIHKDKKIIKSALTTDQLSKSNYLVTNESLNHKAGETIDTLTESRDNESNMENSLELPTIPCDNIFSIEDETIAIDGLYTKCTPWSRRNKQNIDEETHNTKTSSLKQTTILDKLKSATRDKNSQSSTKSPNCKEWRKEYINIAPNSIISTASTQNKPHYYNSTNKKPILLETILGISAANSISKPILIKNPALNKLSNPYRSYLKKKNGPENSAPANGPDTIRKRKSSLSVIEKRFNKTKRKSSKRFKKWSRDETIQFYLGLKTFGSDFKSMLKLFPQRDEEQLKLKFKRENLINMDMVNDAIMNPNGFDMDDLKLCWEYHENVFNDALQLPNMPQSMKKFLKSKQPKQNKKSTTKKTKTIVSKQKSKKKPEATNDPETQNVIINENSISSLPSDILSELLEFDLAPNAEILQILNATNMDYLFEPHTFVNEVTFVNQIIADDVISSKEAANSNNLTDVDASENIAKTSEKMFKSSDCSVSNPSSNVVETSEVTLSFNKTDWASMKRKPLELNDLTTLDRFVTMRNSYFTNSNGSNINKPPSAIATDGSLAAISITQPTTDIDEHSSLPTTSKNSIQSNQYLHMTTENHIDLPVDLNQNKQSNNNLTNEALNINKSSTSNIIEDLSSITENAGPTEYKIPDVALNNTEVPQIFQNDTSTTTTDYESSDDETSYSISSIYEIESVHDSDDMDCTLNSNKSPASLNDNITDIAKILALLSDGSLVLVKTANQKTDSSKPDSSMYEIFSKNKSNGELNNEPVKLPAKLIEAILELIT